MRKREIPVYLFTGLLESGKTSFIRETLKEGEFEDGLSSLYLLCEEGMEECDEILLSRNKVKVFSVEEEEQIQEKNLKAWETKYHPDRILIEYNGMWDINRLIEEFPENWMLVQVITTVDTSTFQVYMANMKALVMAQVADSDLVVFNRCTEQTDRASLRRSIKALNRKAQIIYETVDGIADDTYEEVLPFDINAPVIEVEDDDFGLWYLDALDAPDKYKGKIVKFKGVVYQSKELPKNVFVPGRFAMTCCADDIAFIGFLCKSEEANKLPQKSWVTVKARVNIEYSKDYEGEGPVLYAETIEQTSPPEENIVYFT